jgi:hypothetical protein
MSRLVTALTILGLAACVEGERDKAASARGTGIYEVSQDVVSTATCFNFVATAQDGQENAISTPAPSDIPGRGTSAAPRVCPTLSGGAS